MKPLFLSLVLALATCAARAEVITIQWDARQRFEATSSVLPGKFVEVCGTLTPGETVHWSFESAARLDFNIHYHAGKKVVYPVEPHLAAREEGLLAPPDRQDYCWMWTNRGADAGKLVVTLRRTRR